MVGIGKNEMMEQELMLVKKMDEEEFDYLEDHVQSEILAEEESQNE